MKKIYFFFIFTITITSFAQGPPPPLGCRADFVIDNDNDGFAPFDIDNYINSLRQTALQAGYNFSGYLFQMRTMGGTPISGTYTNTVINEEWCELIWTYSGNGPQYDAIILYQYINSCHKLITIRSNQDADNDSVLNGIEDINNNFNPSDDNTDGVGYPNYMDNDDDNDGILTINEDYNGNGSVLDDDMNGNGIVDYLDSSARGTLTVNLKLFIEGYYAGSGMMRSVRYNQDGISPLTDVENITVELHNATVPFGFITSATAMLKTNGTVTCSFPTASVGSYFIVVKSGNGIPTWSANPQTLSTTPLTYDFSTAANKAYGNNMKALGSGVFGLYSGDINQDDFIDATDYSLWETDANTFAFGNKTTDCNGDGLIDPTDYSVWETNNNNFIAVSKPE